jgi:DNA-binding XRE family transcriptional regulator
MAAKKVPTKTWTELEKKHFTPKQIAASDRYADAEVLEMNLSGLRWAAGKTQKEMARAIGMGQPELSRVERREDHLLSTLRRYVEALGGEVEVIARFGVRAVRLTGV